MRSYLFAALATAALCSMCLAAWSQETGELPYSAKVEGISTNPPVSNIWTYTVYNTSSCADYGVCQIGIQLDDSIVVNSIVTPAGWASDINDRDRQSNLIYLFTTGADMAPGISQSGFVVNFNQAPQEQVWCAVFNNIETSERPYDYGTVATAGSVPEPGSIVALLAGLTSLAALAKRRRS